MILVYVVPNLLAIMPPRRGVHVLLRLKADIKRLNSVLSVPISWDSRDFRGPSMCDALVVNAWINGRIDKEIESTY